MANRVCHLDFETFAAVDLRTVGLDNYVNHPSFEVTVVAWAFDDGTVFSLPWPHSKKLPEAIAAHLMAGGEIHAWNAAFEWNVLVAYYKLPVALEAMSCTMQRALAYGLPAGLLEAGKAIGAAVVKDDTARRLMLKMSKPGRNGEKYFETDSQGLTDLADYCRRDVLAEREMGKLVPELHPIERTLSLLDARSNAVGIVVDALSVTRLQQAASLALDQLDRECARLTNGAVTSPGTQTQRLLDWLTDNNALYAPKLDKEIVAAMLEVGYPPPVQRVLEIRQLAAKSSVKKLQRMADWASTDYRARNLLQFCGAGRTLRWAGRGIQVQNLPRGYKGFDFDRSMRLVDADPGALELFFASPLHEIATMLRGCLRAESGMRLVMIDLAQIEARVLAWLAGQSDVLEAFRKGEDVYVLAAAKVGSGDRQLGKVLTLACGYGMGPGRFQETAKTYGLELALWQCERLVWNWRDGNPMIKDYWKRLEAAVLAALGTPGKVIKLSREVAVRYHNGVLQVRKPNGVKLTYHGMRLTPEGLEYDGVDQKTGRWGRVRTYGGKLVENLTQAVARDVMAEAMLVIDQGFGLVPVMTVHDEVVWEVPEEDADSFGGLLQQMVEIPLAWAEGLPIGSDLRVAWRYGK